MPAIHLHKIFSLGYDLGGWGEDMGSQFQIRNYSLHEFSFERKHFRFLLKTFLFNIISNFCLCLNVCLCPVFNCKSGDYRTFKQCNC